MDKKLKLRKTCQILIIGLLITSGTLPGFTSAINASADDKKETKTSVSSDTNTSPEGITSSETEESLTPKASDDSDLVPKTFSTLPDIKSVVNASADDKKETKTSASSETGERFKLLESGYYGKCFWYTYIEEGDVLRLKRLAISGGHLSVLGVGEDAPPWAGRTDIDIVEIVTPTIAVGSLRGLFSGLKNVSTVKGLNNLDTSQVTAMTFMFNDMSSLTSLDVSGFDTSKVTNMSSMFNG
ncbi:BspA family leucine-rich repeat surface protein, partial [Lactococcus garvieae]